MRRLTLLVLAALLLAPCAWAATCPACSTYAIVLRPGFEAEAVMPVLSGIAGAELQQESSRMIVSTTPARARLLAADGRVASVERITLRAETNTAESWSAGVSYAYDGAGNITAMGGNAYIYDTAGRLVSGTVGGASNKQEFSYDAFGNRKTVTRTGTACKGGFDCESSPAVDPATNRLKRSTTAPAAPDITYDQAGNLTMLDVSHTYTYDALGSMTKQVDGAATREYVYTADDERLGVYNGTWDWTVRDLGGRVLREYTSTGASGTSNWKWRRDHVYRGSQLLATVNQKYDANDNVITGTTTYHLHLDHLGTPRLITDATGLLLSEHAYYPFGPELNLPPTESPRDPQQYTGHERDDIADIHGLDYMHARYYGAAVGRFLSVDPVLGKAGSPQTWNRYAYVANNPIGRNDPSGKCGEPAYFIGPVQQCKSFKEGLQKAAEYDKQEAARIMDDARKDPMIPPSKDGIIATGAEMVLAPLTGFARAGLMSGVTEGTAGAVQKNVIVNLGGEGEVSGANVVNVQAASIGGDTGLALRNAVDIARSSGQPVVMASGDALPFATGSVSTVVTNSVPIDAGLGYFGQSFTSAEIWRILAPGGQWIGSSAP